MPVISVFTIARPAVRSIPVALALAVVAAGCDPGGGRGALSDAPAGGSVALIVSLPDVAVTTVRYQLSGNGFSRSGDIDVSAAGATASVLIGGVPAGTGYEVALSAASIDGRTTCMGAAVADVIANAMISVSIAVECRISTSFGGVVGSARFNFCPQVTSLSGTPAMISLGTGDAVEVSAVAQDRDGNPLTYSWTAPTGSFDDPSAANTVFRCAGPGLVNVTVAVTDGSCSDTVSAEILCLPYCATRPDGTPCNDGSACSRTDLCLQGQCVGGDPVVCVALDGCHVPGTCDPGSGICGDPLAPDGLACQDLNPCTRVDLCQSGLCVGGDPLVCTASDQCHVPGICETTGTNAGMCSNPQAADGSSCQLPGASAACASGACTISSCVAGVGNCDGVAANGCETPTNTAANCGTCGHACGAGTSCVSGLCVPAPPTGLAATAGGWKIHLIWTASPGATGYEVWRSNSAAGPFQSLGRTNGNRFTDLAVVSAVTYVYAVTATNVEGSSARSTTTTATAATKQICLNSNALHSVLVFGADQTDAAIPLRTLGGTPSFGFPTAVASSMPTDQLFVMKQGGGIDVFALAASGAAAPLRTLAGGGAGGLFYALDRAEATNEIFAVQFSPGGQVLSLDATSGMVTRRIAGPATQLGNSVGLIVDNPNGEILISALGSSDPAAAFSRVSAFDITGSGGNIAPRRVLGGPGDNLVGGWAIALDRSRDQIFTTCNCNNRITIFSRTAVGGAPPLRTLELPIGISSVYALLMDEAADTVWALGRTSDSSYTLAEFPRGANGSVSPLRPPLVVGTPGRLAPCN